MAMYYNGKKVCNLYYNGKCITQLALGKEMTRLVEGDDFVRAEWLCGRNGAYINTGYVPIPTEDFFMFKINNNGFWKNPNNDDPHVFGVYSPRIRFGTFASAENRYFFQYNNVIGGAAPYFTSPDYIQEVTLLNDGTKTKCIANGIVSEYETTITEQFNDSIWLYAINNAPSKYFHGDIAYFNIEPNKVRMTPCRLLRPIPASLDANGIARSAGECGMYDAVSGKFFGNVENSGTFTVEPSLVEGVDYERHKWLKGDGSAYIQVLGLVRNENWEITTSIANIQPTTHWILLYGYGYDAETGYNKAWTAFCDQDTTYIRLRRCDGTTYNDNALATVQSVNTIIDGHNSVTINGKTFTMSGRQYGQIPEFRIFSQFRDNLSTTIEKCSFSEFVVKENNIPILHLVPVRLLRPLPSYLDANGKARKQFECGMLDLKTMKFYGNVATTGNFTVSDN